MRPGLTLRDAVHHRAEHQDVRAAVRAASQPAVAAQACRTGRRHNMDTLVTTILFTDTGLKHVIGNLGENLLEFKLWLFSSNDAAVRVGSRLLRGPDPVSK